MDENQLQGVEATGKVIGTGAYGTVIELKYKGLICAGKRIHETLLQSTQYKSLLQRFEAEYCILAKLRHPNIVQYLGVYFESGTPILVMECLHTTLSHCIEQHGILPNEIAYPILQNIALGLCYLHGQMPPFIHRDLSANNVLLTSDMKAKIADLGVAKILDVTPAQKSHMTSVPGTPVYMPPEAMAKNPAYDTKFDNFSYGVLILHIFSGEWPVPEMAVKRDPRRPNSITAVSEVDRRGEFFRKMGSEHPLMSLTLKCLSNFPEQRPEAGEIVAHIEEVNFSVQQSFDNRIQAVQLIRKTQEGIQYILKENLELAEEKNRISSIHGLDIEQMKMRHEAELRERELLHKREVERIKLQMSELNQEAMKKKQPTPKRMDRPSIFQPGAQFKWYQCADMPSGMFSAQAVVIDDRVYVGGGSMSNQNTVLVYDVNHDSWDVLPKLSVAYFGLAKLAEQLVTVGGICEQGTTTNTVYSYFQDSTDQPWQPIFPPMPTPRSGVTAVSFESNLVACGGSNRHEKFLDRVEVFKLGTYQWYQASCLPVASYLLSSTEINSVMYLGGGYQQIDEFASTIMYVPLTTLVETAVLADSMASRQCLDSDSYMTAVPTDSTASLRCFDSDSHMTMVSTVSMASHQSFNSDSQWKTIQRSKHDCNTTLASLDRCVLLLGSTETGLKVRAKCRLYLSFTKEWVSLAGSPVKSFHPVVANLSDGSLLVFGGRCTVDKQTMAPKTQVYKLTITF